MRTGLLANPAGIMGAMASSMTTAVSSDVIARYEPVIGLEVHVQLATRTKIFCGCPTSFGAPPNTNVCPVCLGLPGALPVLSRHAVELAIQAALARRNAPRWRGFASSHRSNSACSSALRARV